MIKYSLIVTPGEKLKERKLADDMDLAIGELVEVKAAGIRLGHRGRVVNQFAGRYPLYAVQFRDSCIAFVERSELGKILPGEAVIDWGKDIIFQDMFEKETRP